LSMRHALAIVSVAVLAFAFFLQPAISQQGSEDRSAVQLYQDGLEAYEAGQYKQARQLFRQLDPQNLPRREQRINLYRALQAIDRQLNPEAAAEATDQPEPSPAPDGQGDQPAGGEASATDQPNGGPSPWQDEQPQQAEAAEQAQPDQPEQAEQPVPQPRAQPNQAQGPESPQPDADEQPDAAEQAAAQPEPEQEAAAAEPSEPAEPQQLLEQARAAADRDLEQAAELYQQVLQSPAAGRSVKRKAEAELVQLRRLQEPSQTAAREMIDFAAEAIEAGNYRTARARLQAVDAEAVHRDLSATRLTRRSCFRDHLGYL